MKLTLNQSQLSQSAKDKFATAFEAWMNHHHGSLERMTVKSLTKLAKLNRITFYHHYSGIDDFIIWYLHKDLIFQLQKEEVLRLEVALNIVYEFIDNKRKFLRTILASKYERIARQFIEKEALTYQLRNFDRLDPQQTYSNPNRQIVAKFYAHGITHLIIRYITDDDIIGMGKVAYLQISQSLVKNYIERLLNTQIQL